MSSFNRSQLDRNLTSQMLLFRECRSMTHTWNICTNTHEYRMYSHEQGTYAEGRGKGVGSELELEHNNKEEWPYTLHCMSSVLPNPSATPPFLVFFLWVFFPPSIFFFFVYLFLLFKNRLSPAHRLVTQQHAHTFFFHSHMQMRIQIHIHIHKHMADQLHQWGARAGLL